MAEVHQVRLVRCPICKNLLQEQPGCSIYRCGACDSVLQAKKKVSVDGRGSLEDPGKEELSDNNNNNNNNRRKERFAKQRTVNLEANRIFEGRNSSHGNGAEKGPYPSQFEGIGDGSWRSRVNRSRLSSDGGSRGGCGSSYLPGTRVCSDPNWPSKTSRLEQDQGLMRKLDELKEEVGMRSKLRERPCCSYHGPSSLRQYGFGPVLHPHRCEMAMQDLSVLQNDLCQARTSTSSGPFRPKPCRNWRPPSHDHFPKRFMSGQPASNMPSCSCFHCDTRDSSASSRGPRTIPGLVANPVSFGPSRTNRSTESLTSQLRDEQSNPRQRSSMDSDADSFDWYRRPTMIVHEPSKNRKRLCHPVADGAPFIACLNCLELLRLPNVLHWGQQNNHQKLQCGACSMVLFLSIRNKKLRISLQGKKKQKQASDRDHNFSDTFYKLESAVGKVESGNGYGSPKLEDNIVLPTVLVRNASTSAKRRTIGSSSSLDGKNAEDLEAIESHKEASSSSSDSPALPLKHEEPTSQSSDDDIDRVGEGNGIKVDEINVVDDKVSSEQRSGKKDEMVSTEVDDSFQEYLKNELSQEHSNEFSQEAKGTRIINGAESVNAYGSPKSEDNVVLPMVLVRNVSTGTERRTIGSSSSLDGKQADALEAIRSHKEASSSSDPPAPLLKREEPMSQSPDDDIDRVGKGNVVNDKVSYEQRGGKKEEMVSTEVDDSFQEYLKSELSQERSNEFSQEAKGTRIINWVEPFLVNVTKNSFKDLSLSSQRKGRTNEDPEVFVNGQPILQHQVAKAEKLAGPISPGNYWYDWEAGFWGVFGQPCLGILPPFIQEFVYPIPASCAAGNTGVFVNGRELHENDLELLSSKGLPTSRDKLYDVDFFGRVVDKDSGEEVANLGKLAPTVERQNRGFGMWVPDEVL